MSKKNKKMSIRSRFISIFSKKGQPIRAISEITSIPKSTVHYHLQQGEQRNQYPESTFWETEAGNAFLRNLVIATIYTFCIKGGIGAGRVHEFFSFIRIGTHIAISETTILKTINEIEKLILDYNQAKQAKIKSMTKEIKMILGVDGY